jgi:hypothetical protein
LSLICSALSSVPLFGLSASAPTVPFSFASKLEGERVSLPERAEQAFRGPRGDVHGKGSLRGRPVHGKGSLIRYSIGRTPARHSALYSEN